MPSFPLFLILCYVTTVHPTKDYCTICPARTHIMCKYKKGPSAVCHNYRSSEIDSDDAKTAIVDMHNQFRSRVAQGLEERGNPGPQPPAANMLKLEWDDELAEIAQRIADQCFDSKQQFSDDCRLTERFSYGLMIASLIHKKDAPLDFAYTFNFWYNNVQVFQASLANKFEISLNKSLNGFSYYTQIVWAKTRLIGCGHAVFEQNVTLSAKKGAEPRFFHRLVCNYAPMGNIIGEEVYKTGQACSFCPEGYGCSADYPGLCTNISFGPIVVEDGLISQMEIDFSQDLNGTQVTSFPSGTSWRKVKLIKKQTPKTETVKVNKSDDEASEAPINRERLLYNEGDECYCGYLMRTAASGRSLILDGRVVLSTMTSFISVLIYVMY